MIETNPIIEAKKNFHSHLSKGKLVPLSEINFQVEEIDYPMYHQLLKSWYKRVHDLNFLPMGTAGLEEIFIHSPSNITLKTSSVEFKLESDLTTEDLNTISDILVQKNDLDWNYKDPFVSFHSQINNTPVRITMVHHSTGQNDYPKIFIRILNHKVIPLTNYTKKSGFYKDIIKNKSNVLIAGSTGSGKTTFCNTLLSSIPEDEHVIIIEDTKELISPNNQTTRLIADQKNENKSINSYLSYALRMSPERIILGEIRGKEAESSLLSMNTGHNGYLSTIHANSAKDAIYRLSLLFKIYSSKDLGFELVLKLITSNINYVIFLENKEVTEIIEVFGSDKENIFFENVELG